MKNMRAFEKPGRAIFLAILLALAGCASRSPAPVFERGGQLSSATDKDSYAVKHGDTLYSIAREHGMDPHELIAMNGIVTPNSIKPGMILKVKPPIATSTVASAVPITTDVVDSRPFGSEQGVGTQLVGTNTETLKREPKAGKEPYSDQALALAQNQNQPKATESASAAAANSEAKPEPPPAAIALSGDEIAWAWPATGKIIGTFSEGSNKGIDIAGKAGDPVLAAGDGKVIIANFLRGYGKLVIVKHNKTYVSVYGHNRTLLVKEGQLVVKGQKIAEMGNTDADQVKLHFEIRSKGKPLDPLKFLPQR